MVEFRRNGLKAYALKDDAGDTWVIVIEDLEMAKDIAYEWGFDKIEEVALDDEVLN